MHPESEATITPPLTVEVVDEFWLPLPGVEVVVTSNDGTRKSWRKATDADGTAAFDVQLGTKYGIEAHGAGFKKTRLSHVQIAGGSAQVVGARVQLRLLLSRLNITVY